MSVERTAEGGLGERTSENLNIKIEKALELLAQHVRAPFGNTAALGVYALLYKELGEKVAEEAALKFAQMLRARGVPVDAWQTREVDKYGVETLVSALAGTLPDEEARRVAARAARLLGIGRRVVRCVEEAEDGDCLRRVSAYEVGGKLYVYVEKLRCTKDGCGWILREIYGGPKPVVVIDEIRRLTFYRLGDIFASDLNNLVEKLKAPAPRLGVYADLGHLDQLAAVFQEVAEEERRTFLVGVLPTESGAVLYDDHRIIDVGPSPADAVAEFNKALLSVLEAYPAENRNAALATVGVLLALNLAPVYWRHRPRLPVPIAIIHGRSGLGKSKLLEKIAEPAILGASGLRRLGEIRKELPPDLGFYLVPKVVWDVAVKTPQQFRTLLVASPLVLILDEQRAKFAESYADYLLPLATAGWGEAIQIHAPRYGLGQPVEFVRLRAVAIVTNDPPRALIRRMAESLSAEGAVERRTLVIQWEDAKLPAESLDKLYTPKYSVLGALVELVNEQFAEIVMKPATFLDAVNALYAELIKKYEPLLGKLDGVRAMVEALKELKAEQEERQRAARRGAEEDYEELKNNITRFLRAEAKITDLTPAKALEKTFEYASELSVRLRRCRFAEEAFDVVRDFCEGVKSVIGDIHADCERFASNDESEIKRLFKRVEATLGVDVALVLQSLWRRYIAHETYKIAVVANSPTWPVNTRRLGELPRHHDAQRREFYYIVPWSLLLRLFLGEVAFTDDKESSETLDASKEQSELLTYSPLLTSSQRGVEKQNFKTLGGDAEFAESKNGEGETNTNIGGLKKQVSSGEYVSNLLNALQSSREDSVNISQLDKDRDTAEAEEERRRRELEEMEREAREALEELKRRLKGTRPWYE